MDSGVYAIRNVVNGKRYIGSTNLFRRRELEHLNRLRSGKHGSLKLQRAFNKYGEESFAFEILDECLVSQLTEREQHYIDACRPEYNICLVAGAQSRRGLKNTPEHCARISAGKRLPIVMTRCRICHIEFENEHRGDRVTKTCGQNCHSELSRRMQLARLEADPDLCRRAQQKWQIQTGRKGGTGPIGRLLTSGGVTQCMSAWSVQLGGDAGLVSHRLKNGWDQNKALTQLVKSLG